VAANDIAGRVEEMARPVAESKGLELVEVQYAGEGGRRYLRVFLDKPGGISLDDCEAVSRELDRVLDDADFIPHSYVLEVSSPGLERPLKRREDFARFNGRLVLIHTYAPLNGRKKFSGRLMDSGENGVTVLIGEHETATIPWNQIARARLAVEF
jgi:ribosome maturation factor RimP